MLRLALIGCGAHARSAHAAPLAHYAAANPGHIALVAACDINSKCAEQVCREYGFAQPFTDWDTMLTKAAPDAVICVLPVEKIAGAGVRLLECSLPCVLEKPLGASPEEVRALADAARRTGTPHMVSVNRRFSPFLNRALHWARDAGPISHIHARMLRHARREEEFIWGTGVHIVDAVRYIGGDIESAEADIFRPSPHSPPWYEISLRFTSGCRGTIEILPTAGVVEETYALSGEGFRAEASTMGTQGARCWRGGNQEVDDRANPDEPVWRRDGSYEETSAFIRSLTDGTPPAPTVEQIAPSVELCHRIAAQVGEKSHDHH